MKQNPSEISAEELKNYQTILDIYQNIFATNPARYANRQRQLELPIIPINILTSLLNRVYEIFSEEPVLMSLSSPITVVGDLHGHIIDLFRIFNKLGIPPKSNYLFLGDIVDRGEFSVETLILILTLKIIYPENVHVIRGNHEFSELCANSGFGSEVQYLYESIPLNALFSRVFSMIPFAAILDNQYFCVHGGIGPDIFSLQSIEKIERPIFKFNPNVVVSELVWSDPMEIGCPFLPSRRGYGYVYGENAVNSFLKETGLVKIIRAHQCISGGVESMFNDRVLTVFSASNYCDELSNRSGILIVSPGGLIEPVFFEPLKGYLLRVNATFIPSLSPDELIIESQSSIKTSSNSRLIPLNLVSKPSGRRKSIQQTASFSTVPNYQSPKERHSARHSLAPYLISRPKKMLQKVSTTTVGLILDPNSPIIVQNSGRKK